MKYEYAMNTAPRYSDNFCVKVTGIGEIGVSMAKQIEKEMLEMDSENACIFSSEYVDCSRTPNIHFTILSECNEAEREDTLSKIQNDSKRLCLILNADRSVDSHTLTDRADAILDIADSEMATAAVNLILHMNLKAGCIGRDFADVCAALKNGGVSYIKKAVSSDEICAEGVASLMLENCPPLNSCHNILFAIYTSEFSEAEFLDAASARFGICDADLQAEEIIDQLYIGDAIEGRWMVIAIFTGVK